MKLDFTEKQIEIFLNKVDRLFPVYLSEKQNLCEFAYKLRNKATICAKLENGEIMSAVCGYTENVVNNAAYISIVATIPEAQGKGYASELVTQFIEIARNKGVDYVHLYAVPDNVGAMKLYKSLGFEEVILENEPRPHDAHLIYYIK